MEPEVLHVSEAEAVRDIASILKCVHAGTEIVIERDDLPVAFLHPADVPRRTLADCIALAKAHEEESSEIPTLDPDFGADMEAIIGCRQPRNPALWD